MKIYQIKQQPTEIAFHAADTGWVMRITADRRIEVNEDVEVTEAAQKVLDAIQHLLTPQQRTWVGLTPEEVKEISLANRPYVVDMVVALEARLKEKNT